MIKDIKLKLLLGKENWLEATWTKEIKSITDIEKEIEENGEIKVQQESITYEQVWCESYSGHKEHISMLKAKAQEFGTSLDEYKDLIEECISKFIYPSDEEIAEQEKQAKLQEYYVYLNNTAWVDSYLIKHYTGIEILPETSNKFIIEKLRNEARAFIRANEEEV